MNIDQWIKVIIDPSEILRIQGGEAMQFSLFAAVLCDQIWMNRNKAVWGLGKPISRFSQPLQPSK